MIRFKMPDEKIHDTNECLRKLNVLGHAQLIELDIGSLCGGHGVCGGDVIRIEETDKKHFSHPTPEEKKHLSEEELNSGYRLACQCYPDSDKLEIIIEVKGNDK